MTENDIKIHNAYINWLAENSDNYSHAVTLTMKPYRNVLTPKGEIPELLTHYEAERNMRFFLTRLNAEVFGNHYKRRGKSLYALPVLEGVGGLTHLHYHCALGNFPQLLCETAIHAKIESAWKQTPFGNEQVCIKPMRDSGWVTYMGKEIGPHNTVAVDVHNARLPSTSLV
jgi:hypothetical protein